jgi:hypothetical protein
MSARAMRKIHVPAYWPSVVGLKAFEKRRVLVEVKNVIDMVDMDMDIDVSDTSMPDMEDGSVEEAMLSMPVVVAVAIDIVVEVDDMSMSIESMFIFGRGAWNGDGRWIATLKQQNQNSKNLFFSNGQNTTDTSR